METSNIYQCFSPVSFKNKYTGEIMSASCGKCPACKKQKQNRIINELTFAKNSYKFAIFFTLTYNDSHLPEVFDDEGISHIVVSKVDITLFIKRLRKCLQLYIKNLDKQILNEIHNGNFSSIISYGQKIKNASFKYFVCAEYGPSTNRPHYHGILFTDCSYLAENSYTLLCKTWKNGFVSCSPAGVESIGYVAKYVTSSSLFSHGCNQAFEKEIFAKKSQQLSNSFLENDIDKLREIVFDGVTNIILERDGKAFTVQLSNSFENKWFPKCRQFAVLSHKGRLANYLEYFKQKKPLIKDFDFEHLSHDENKSLYYSSLSDYYVCKKFIENSYYFGVSFDKYLSLIELYYDNKDMFRLKDFFRRQENYTKANNYKFLNNLYSQVLYNFHRNRPLSVSVGSVSLKDMDNYYYINDRTFHSFVSETNSKIDQSLKTKVLNDTVKLLSNS